MQQHIRVIKKFGAILFNRIDPHNRRRALTGSALLSNTKPPSFPRAVQHLILALDVFREQLVTYYESYKPKASQDRSFFIPDMHRKLGNVFEDAMKELKNDQTELWPLDHIEDRITFLNTKR